MIRFSANLGFLWSDLALDEGIRAAYRAGFDAVECHWTGGQSAQAVRAALDETGLSLLGINTTRGDVGAGEFGIAALPGRQAEARADIDAAFEFAEATDAGAIHIVAGRVAGEAARATYLENLAYAATLAAGCNRLALIEAINPHDVPGYHLNNTQDAAEVIRTIDNPSLKLMFDCYHAARNGEPVLARFRELRPMIGHIQIAGVPHRGPPDQGDLDYRHLLQSFANLGWTRPIGAEYRPDDRPEASLGWMDRFRA